MNIRLRRLEDQDISLFENWLKKSYIAKWYHHPSHWLNEVKKRNNEFQWIHHYIVDYNNHSIGFCQYYEYLCSREDWHGDMEINGTYSIDYLIGESDYLKRGFGKEIIICLINEISNIKNAKRIIVQPEPENLASCGVLLSVGFIYDRTNKLYLLNL